MDRFDLVDAADDPSVVWAADVVVEPLIRKWPAWPLLVAPASGAMLASNAHLPLLESYLAAPDVHFEARADPNLAAGRFVQISPERREFVEDLRDETMAASKAQCRFTRAVGQLRTRLGDHPRGDSLSPLYGEIPYELRGLVELGYSLDDFPEIRFFEGLLYRSALYREDEQSSVVWRPGGDRRPFILNTPRVGLDESIPVVRPFHHSDSGTVYRARHTPVPLSKLAAACDVRPQELLVYVDATTAPAAAPLPPTGLRIRYMGHACLLFESSTGAIMVDPLMPGIAGPSRFTYADLPERLDAIFITHGHQDHVVIETLLHLRDRVDLAVVPRGAPGSLADPSLRLILEACGYRNVVEVSELQALEIGGFRIEPVPYLGEHGDLDIRAKLGYVVQHGDRRVFAAVDAQNVDPVLYDNLRSTIGPVDDVFIGLESVGAPVSWLYGALFTRTLSIEAAKARRLAGSTAAEAAHLVDAFGAARAFVYGMGIEPWTWHILGFQPTESSPQMQEIRTFVEECEAAGVEAQLLGQPCEIV